MADQPSKYCDLVMKGGITSGIVYPNTALEISRNYRFKNIGGTSAGAIAAAVTAAAAMGDRRRHAGDDVGAKAGFEGMRAVADELTRVGFIYSLFQPAAGGRNAFRLAVLLASHASLWRKALGVLAGVFRIAPLEFLAILLALCGLGYVLADWGGAKAALVPALFCAYGGGGTFAVLRVARVIRGNLMGLCTGLGSDRNRRRGAQEPMVLTEWLHTVLQALSGKPEDEPLTFGDLKYAPRYANEPESDFSINLQLITSGISHKEPQTLPFAKKTFWFLEEEFSRLFPSSVVQWMIRQQRDEPIRIGNRIYHRLPEADQLPVLMATRMSLSFPLLISAVPLHEPDAWSPMGQDDAAEAAGAGQPLTAGDQDMLSSRNLCQAMEGLTTGGTRRQTAVTSMRACWFSDGGISSNFPVHLFDAGLPLWPTFAINLVYPKDRGPGDVQVPAASEDEELQQAVVMYTDNNQGWKPSYQAVASPLAVKEVGNFVFGILATMQNWRDLLQSRAPGYRDRIVNVSLTGVEGGMNLNMPAPVLDNISRKGTIAGQRIADFSFENHYWIRWRNLSAALQGYVVEIAANTQPARSVPAYAQAYALPVAGGEPPSYKFASHAAQDRAHAMYDLLREQGAQWSQGPNLSIKAPNPAPQLRITPTY